MTEIWKDVVGYEGLYSISNKGRIIRLEKNRTKGSGNYHKKEIILVPATTKNGYNYVLLYKNKIRKIKKIHQLVSRAFIPNSENKPCVNHINGVKTDNRVKNLEWCTHSENMQHALKTGLIKTMKKVLMLDLNGKELLIFDGVRKAGRETGVSNSGISACCLGQRQSAGGYKWEFAK